MFCHCKKKNKKKTHSQTDMDFACKGLEGGTSGSCLALSWSPIGGV